MKVNLVETSETERKHRQPTDFSVLLSLLLTLVFQGQDGPFLKEKLFKLVQDKPEMTTDSPNRPTSQNENQQTTDNGADSGSENSLFAELRDIKYSLTVLKKQVDEIGRASCRERV